jgi:DnaJ-class molecular chaperone
MNPFDRALRKVGANRAKSMKFVLCEECHGAGYISNNRGYSTPCGACGGSGKVNAEICRS